MPWVRIDEDFAQHPKVAQAGPLAIAMQVAGLCYANKHLTDGFVPRPVVPSLINLEGVMFNAGEDARWEQVVADLERAGMWQRIDGGWIIHDFRDYQPSKREVLRLRRQRSDAGRKGGKAKAQANGLASAKQTSSKRSGKRASEVEAKSCPVPGPGSGLDLDLVSTDFGDFTDVGSPPAATNGEVSTPKKNTNAERHRLAHQNQGVSDPEHCELCEHAEREAM